MSFLIVELSLCDVSGWYHITLQELGSSYDEAEC